jgi:hypothetical protein
MIQLSTGPIIDDSNEQGTGMENGVRARHIMMMNALSNSDLSLRPTTSQSAFSRCTHYCWSYVTARADIVPCT